jgi:outer membrane biosynthesis protein TonB
MPGTPREAGRESDRESDFAATQRADKVRLGQPLATKGLKIRTVKPRSSHYNAVLARYVDPVIRVSFDREGVVRNVEFLRRSENPDVDRYVENAAFQWTAEGPPLEKLPPSTPGQPPATLSVDFSIVRPLSG